MARETSVVTPQRFSEGFAYDAYLAHIEVNKARFDGFYDGCRIQPENAATFRELADRPNGPAKMLVLGEDWCGDVVRGLPVLARVAEAGGMELRIFPRDLNRDIMNEFLNRGEFMSIPVAVFYTRGHRYICHWIERPAMASRETGEIEAAIRAENPEINDQEFSRERRARTSARAGNWIEATVEELRELLAGSVS
ncbi:MAG TPA: thioredoxin family protein [Dehalococcoidia bacterium]|nr:thioredoxin family protein [Dehalococcoidia bacterium]